MHTFWAVVPKLKPLPQSSVLQIGSNFKAPLKSYCKRRGKAWREIDYYYIFFALICNYYVSSLVGMICVIRQLFHPEHWSREGVTPILRIG